MTIAVADLVILALLLDTVFLIRLHAHAVERWPTTGYKRSLWRLQLIRPLPGSLSYILGRAFLLPKVEYEGSPQYLIRMTTSIPVLQYRDIATQEPFEDIIPTSMDHGLPE